MGLVISGLPDGGDGIETVSTTCSICLESMVDDGSRRSMANLQCGHQFHLSCIGAAFNVKGSMQCPNCRLIENEDWLYSNNEQLHGIHRREIKLLRDLHRIYSQRVQMNKVIIQLYDEIIKKHDDKLESGDYVLAQLKQMSKLCQKIEKGAWLYAWELPTDNNPRNETELVDELNRMYGEGIKINEVLIEAYHGVVKKVEEKQKSRDLALDERDVEIRQQMELVTALLRRDVATNGGTSSTQGEEPEPEPEPESVLSLM